MAVESDLYTWAMFFNDNSSAIIAASGTLLGTLFGGGLGIFGSWRLNKQKFKHDIKLKRIENNRDKLEELYSLLKEWHHKMTTAHIALVNLGLGKIEASECTEILNMNLFQKENEKRIYQLEALAYLYPFLDKQKFDEVTSIFDEMTESGTRLLAILKSQNQNNQREKVIVLTELTSLIGKMNDSAFECLQLLIDYSKDNLNY